MASTQSLDGAPSSQSTERPQLVRPAPAGFLARRQWIGLGLLLMGYSRLYMGDHYPTDVLGGFSFGLAWGALVFTSFELFCQRRSARHSKADGL